MRSCFTFNVTVHGFFGQPDAWYDIQTSTPLEHNAAGKNFTFKQLGRWDAREDAKRPENFVRLPLQPQAPPLPGIPFELSVGLGRPNSHFFATSSREAHAYCYVWSYAGRLSWAQIKQRELGQAMPLPTAQGGFLKVFAVTPKLLSGPPFDNINNDNVIRFLQSTAILKACTQNDPDLPAYVALNQPRQRSTPHVMQTRLLRINFRQNLCESCSLTSTGYLFKGGFPAIPQNSRSLQYYDVFLAAVDDPLARLPLLLALHDVQEDKMQQIGCRLNSAADAASGAPPRYFEPTATAIAMLSSTVIFRVRAAELACAGSAPPQTRPLQLVALHYVPQWGPVIFSVYALEHQKLWEAFHRPVTAATPTFGAEGALAVLQKPKLKAQHLSQLRALATQDGFLKIE